MTIPPEQVQPVATKLRIIYVALASGLVTLSAVAFFVNASAGDSPMNPNLMLGLVGMMAVGEFAAWFAIRPMLQKQFLDQRRDATEEMVGPLRDGHLLVAYIIPGAMIEGIGCLCAMLFMVSRISWLLAAPAVAVALLLISFPSADRLTQYLERLERRL